MKIAEVAGIATLTAVLGLMTSPGSSIAQEASVPKAASGASTIDTINAEYEAELVKLERRRLDHLGRLALSQRKDQAAATFEAYFRLAIAKNLYADADPIARKVLQAEDPSSSVVWLAHLVHIVAEADRGAYEESLQALASAIRIKGRDPKAATRDSGLPVGTRASIVDAYYQRLIHGDQVDVARKAMKLVADNTDVPAIRDLAGRRLKQLDLVGRPAPPIVGVDLEGRPFKLADARGEVVLVVFWATWCLPNAQEMPWLEHLYATYRPRGLRVVGINLDSAQDGGRGLQSAMPNIRRFLLDYNVTWPTLANGPGDQDFAGAFGVTEIPANVLIGRDGKIIHLDLTGKKLEKAIAQSIAQKP
jgi:thiol-disulfide isomerase/thioredoxin